MDKLSMKKANNKYKAKEFYKKKEVKRSKNKETTKSDGSITREEQKYEYKMVIKRGNFLEKLFYLLREILSGFINIIKICK